MVGVGSYPELYLAIFGWLQYDRLWEILTGTGLAYLPFLIILIQNIVDPLKSQEARDAGTTSVKRMQVDMLIAFTVVVLAAVPAIDLSADVVAYEKPCDTAMAGAGEYTPGATGTSYDESFSELVATPAQVPVWWFGIMAISAGINNQAIADIGCITDVTGFQAQLDQTRVDNPELANELNLFIQHCYLPAVSRFQREKPEVPEAVLEGADASGGGPVGLWPGSAILIETEGLYDDLRPSEPIRGWSYDAARDTEYPPELLDQYDQANIGMPFCDDWWTEGSIGLRGKILDEVDPTTLQSALAFVPDLFSFAGTPTNEEVENDIIRGVIRTTQASAPVGDAFMPSLNDEGGFLNDVVSRLASLGTVITEPAFDAGIYTLRAALPVFQSLLLGGIYALLGLALIAGLYSLRSLLLLSVLVFTVKFWSYLWHLAWWLEQNLVSAMFSGAYGNLSTSIQGLTGGLSALGFLQGADFGLKLQVIEYATALLFIVLPLLFTALMSAVGVGAAVALGAAFTAGTGAVQGAGQAGGSAVTGAAQSVASRRVGR